MAIDKKASDRVVSKINPKRRDTMRKMLVGGFTAPTVSSFTLSTLAIRGAQAQSGSPTAP